MRSVLAILLLGAVAAPAQAQTACAVRDFIARSLAATHEEVPVGQGLTAGGDLIEVFASTEGTWTVVVTQPSKLSCIHAAGVYWLKLPPPVTELEGPPSS